MYVRKSVKVYGAGVALSLVMLAVSVVPVSANSPVTGAAFTTVNEDADGAGHCKNGNPNVNCNIYDGKEFVWMSGGPATAYVGDGAYFFAVLEPGGQVSPNDGAEKNLSDDFDAYTNRTFSVSNGIVSYTGTHDISGNKIRLMPYANTPNPGGVYILAICSLADGYPIQPNNCKYDAFKIQTTEVVLGFPLTTSMDVEGNNQGVYDQTYSWSIDKNVDKTLVKQVGGSATFNYTVIVDHSDGVIDNVKVNGTFTVTNPNSVLAIVDGITVKLSDTADCTVDNGDAQTLQPGDTAFTFECSLASLPAGELTHKITVSWSEQLLENGNLLVAGVAELTSGNISFTGNAIDECANVTDSFTGALGSLCLGDVVPSTYTYSRTVTMPAFNCMTFDNTATYTANDTGASNTVSKSVMVCGPAKTGTLTIGFWQNKNGQGIISGQAASGVCSSGVWLRQFAPYQDLSATATCPAVANYVFNVIKSANASGSSMNAMLKAQMLATALDVYFSNSSLGGNRINAPSPIGIQPVDLTMVCTDMTCTTYQDSSSVFGGAPKTVLEMLTAAASNANAGGSQWYGNVKATQELAKDAFDAINNENVFAP